VQRAVLNQLFGEAIAQRLVNNEAKVDDPKDALRVSELYATLHAAVWSELKPARDIPLMRRNLQREYVTRLAGALVRPASSLPADARALLRADANSLRAELAQARTVQLSPDMRALRAAIDEAPKAAGSPGGRI
jgi:hypothetical protein